MTQNNEREALISDAKEAGFINHPIHGLVVRHSNGSWISIAGKLEKFATLQLARAISQNEQQEPFGYFKAEPFGWTDCAEADEGAIPLYESPPKQAIPEGWKLISDELPITGIRVLIYTDGVDFNGEQYFDVQSDSLNECFYENRDDMPEVCIHATHWMPLPEAPTTSLTSETNTEVGK